MHAADSWARCNPGKIGVAAVTAGPGVTDGVTGVANAWRANSPILVFGGQGPFANLRRGSLQEMDHIGVMRPITKYADAVYQTHRIPEYVELAIRHAVSGIPGPAYLEIPMDVFMGQAEESQVTFPRIRTEPPRISPDREEVRRAIALLERAKRPMLMAGTSVKWSRASAAMCRFIQETHIPSYTNGMGRGTIPPGLARVPEPLAARGAGEDRLHPARGHPARLPHALRTDDPRRREDHPARDGRDPDRAEPRQPTSPLVGNLGCSFELLSEEMKNQGVRLDFSGFRDELRAIENKAERKVEAALGSDAVPIDPQRLCREVRDWLETLARSDRDRRRRRHRRHRGEDPAGQARGLLDGSRPARHARRRHALRAGRADHAPEASAS